ncbi:24312_t:CDS:2, partial [Gigaspora rosea]
TKDTRKLIDGAMGRLNKSIVKGIKNVNANDQGGFEDNVRMMCIERINKDVESIERSGAVIAYKIEVDKEKIDK